MQLLGALECAIVYYEIGGRATKSQCRRCVVFADPVEDVWDRRQSDNLLGVAAKLMRETDPGNSDWTCNFAVTVGCRVDTAVEIGYLISDVENQRWMFFL